MVLQLVVFDLDGTLVTAEIDFHAMRQAIRDLLISNGFPPEVLPMNSTQDLLRSAFAHAQTQGHSPVEISELRDKVYAVAVEIEWEGAKKAQLVPGARETLEELRNRHINVAILTNDNREVADFLLAKYEMDVLVNLLISRDEAPHMKPSTEGLESILKHFGVTPNETLFIGDSTIDIMTAKKLRIPCIARLSKVRNKEELPTLEPIIPYLVEHDLLPPPAEDNKTKG
jgi:HAD superfamily hydrolase (TIGR01549 family)